MKIELTPTEELVELGVNGAKIPTRLWTGTTEQGLRVEAFIFSIVPGEGEDYEEFKRQLPDFMLRTRDVCTLDEPS